MSVSQCWFALSGDLQDPARHRDGHTVVVQLAVERVQSVSRQVRL
jgi:hypothetical protein